MKGYDCETSGSTTELASCVVRPSGVPRCIIGCLPHSRFVHAADEKERPAGALPVDALDVVAGKPEQREQRRLHARAASPQCPAPATATASRDERRPARERPAPARASAAAAPRQQEHPRKHVAERVDEEVHEQPDESGRRVRRCASARARAVLHFDFGDRRATRTASGFRNRRSSPNAARLRATSSVNAFSGHPMSRSGTPASRVTSDVVARENN